MPSRYQNLYQYNYKGRRITLSPTFLSASYWQTVPKTYYQVQIHDRLDKIANEFYDGNDSLMWIIMMANGLDLPTDILPGDVLLIPLDYRGVVQAVATANRNVSV